MSRHIKKVKRLTRKLTKALSKATRKELERDFANTESSVKAGFGKKSPSPRAIANMPDLPEDTNGRG